jgi:hypothetical protein
MNLYSKNQAGLNKFPPDMVPKGELYGQVHCLYDEYTLVGALTSGDLIKMGSIPIGSRILDATVFSDDIDGSIAVGEIATGALEEGAGNSSVAELIPSTAVATAAVLKMSGAATNAGLLKKTTAEYVVGIKCTATSAAAVGAKIRLLVLYVMD